MEGIVVIVVAVAFVLGGVFVKRICSSTIENEKKEQIDIATKKLNQKQKEIGCK